MKGSHTDASDANTALRGALDGAKPKRTMRGARRASAMIAANVREDEYAAIVEHARRGGYESLAEYVRAVCIARKAIYDTDQARLAKPLADIAYRVVRGMDALDRGEMDVLRGYLLEIRAVVADALRPLSRHHDREVRSRQ